MPVTQLGENVGQHERDLSECLAFHQSQCQRDNTEIIINYAQALEPIDPLVFFQHFDQPDDLSFYWENPQQEIAIASTGSALSQQFQHNHRFSQVGQFIQTTRQKTIRLNPNPQLKSNPHFFCTFTFFDTALQSPFSAATVFLPRLQLITQQQQTFLIANFRLTPRLNLDRILAQWRHTQQRLTQLQTPIWDTNTPSFIQPLSPTTQPFKTAVQAALKTIQQQKLQKIVLAHSLDVIASQPFNLIHSLHNLRQKHPDCYTFATSNGKGDYFIGASPERLISIRNQTLITDALAGSSRRGRTPTEDRHLAQQLLHSEKELREHQVVRQFIVQRLRELGLDPQQANLQLLQLDNIQHLWTPITAQLPAQIDPLKIVAQLHPTPAVAGVPTQLACDQIRTYEPFDRGLYAAPIGWVDDQGNSEFIVGIRSALIRSNHAPYHKFSARLYGGAGIVAGSDPDKELAEVQLKLQTLLKSLV